MLSSSICDYSESYILVKGTLTVRNITAQGQASNAVNKKVIFKNCALFNIYISRINNTKVDDAHDIDVVMTIYDLIECNDNFSKTSGILW